jgi:hypothetical protein
MSQVRPTRAFFLVDEKSTLDLRTTNQALRRYDGESIALRVSGIRSSLEQLADEKVECRARHRGFPPAESIFR